MTFVKRYCAQKVLTRVLVMGFSERAPLLQKEGGLGSERVFRLASGSRPKTEGKDSRQIGSMNRIHQISCQWAPGVGNNIKLNLEWSSLIITPGQRPGPGTEGW